MTEEASSRQSEGIKLFREGLELDAAGKTIEAVDLYRSAIAVWPENHQAHYNLGVNLATLGQNDQAIRSWRRAVWLHPDFKNELIQALDIDHELRETIIHPNDKTFKRSVAA